MTDLVSFSTSNSNDFKLARRYIGVGALMIVLIALCWGLIVPQFLPSRDANWIDGMYSVKIKRARAVEEQKFVIISGSSGLFGLSAELLERRLKMPTVNLATHAGLGITYILYRAQQVLQAGDTAFLALEYDLLSPRSAPGQTLANFVAAYDPGYLFTGPASWVPHFLTGHDHKSLIWSLIERLGLWRYEQDCYGSAKSLNEYGDETCANTRVFETTYPERLKAQFRLRTVDFNPPKLATSLKDFVIWAKQNEVTIVVGFPPLLRQSIYATTPYYKAFERLLARLKNLGVKTVGQPQDFLYSTKYMYDHRYHLHSLGRAIHSNRMADLICAQVKGCKG